MARCASAVLRLAVTVLTAFAAEEILRFLIAATESTQCLAEFATGVEFALWVIAAAFVAGPFVGFFIDAALEFEFGAEVEAHAIEATNLAGAAF